MNAPAIALARTLPKALCVTAENKAVEKPLSTHFGHVFEAIILTDGLGYLPQIALNKVQVIYPATRIGKEPVSEFRHLDGGELRRHKPSPSPEERPRVEFRQRDRKVNYARLRAHDCVAEPLISMAKTPRYWISGQKH